LTQSHLQNLLKELSASLPVIDISEASVWGDQLESDPDRGSVGLSPEHLAYVIYTSGSTGTPKGVMVKHRGINRLVLNAGYVEFQASDGVAFASSPSFDAATFEIWLPLLHGGCMVIVSQSVLLDPILFAERITRHKVSILWLTVGIFNEYADIL